MNAVEVRLTQANPNDSLARLVEWLVEDGDAVAAGQAIAVFEDSKAAREVEAPQAGWVFWLAPVGEIVEVAGVFAVISDTAARPHGVEPLGAAPQAGSRLVTDRARALMAEHGLTESDLADDLSVIRSADVEAALAGPAGGAGEQRDRVLSSAPGPSEISADGNGAHSLRTTLSELREAMRASWDRHVPTGTLLGDREDLARELGFGAGTTVYDECLVLGSVEVGDNCWIGPYTVLDGSNGLRIGDWTSVGSGAQLYSHNTIDLALTGGIAKAVSAPTVVGSACFIAPMAIVAAGSEIGDHSFVAAQSYVEGSFEPYSYIAGAPARRVGRVEVRGARAILHRDQD